MSYYETERDNRFLSVLHDISKSLKKCGFIEIMCECGKQSLVNVRYIEAIEEITDNRCYVYIHGGGSLPQYHLTVNLPYNRLVEMIKEAVE